jgi:NADPH-dependent ferric siderophore reductase
MAGAARILGELAEDDIDWLLLAGDARAMPAGAVLIEEGSPSQARRQTGDAPSSAAAGTSSARCRSSTGVRPPRP